MQCLSSEPFKSDAQYRTNVPTGLTPEALSLCALWVANTTHVEQTTAAASGEQLGVRMCDHLIDCPLITYDA